MSIEPVSIEVIAGDGLILRGYEWPTRGAPVVLLHDHDDDLDAWHDLDGELATNGFRVINLELRGHGLSDGDANRNTVLSDTQALLKEVKNVWGPVGLCTYGDVAAALCFLDSFCAPTVQIAISPLPSTDKQLDVTQRPDTAYLVISGTGDKKITEQARIVFDSLGRNKLWASVASDQQGPELLQKHRHLIGDMTLFLQRYLVPAHLEWQKTALEQVISETGPQDSKIKK
ncbi:MAG: hypothetical protein MK296_10820 [Gammaproteobacteria bacterium]|jgi:hypothetical protein|nr:hypothetical protein [Gammaproteobacteria bacterium]